MMICSRISITTIMNIALALTGSVREYTDDTLLYVAVDRNETSRA